MMSLNIRKCMKRILTDVGILFLLYRKFLKSSEMVYNDNEIKMSMTKERRLLLRHDVVYAVFVFWFDCTI